MKQMIISNLTTLTVQQKRNAFHQAGHAAGIYFNIKAKKLPPVFCKIIAKNIINLNSEDFKNSQPIYNNGFEYIMGGRLIDWLPHSIDSLIHKETDQNEAMGRLDSDYMLAFDTDIINFLIGPLAEAKFIAEADDELFKPRLINLKALENYGGRSDLWLIDEYLQCFSIDQKIRDKKLNELLIQSFYFIMDNENWKSIKRLAKYILLNSTDSISCEEMMSILDPSIKHPALLKNSTKIFSQDIVL